MWRGGIPASPVPPGEHRKESIGPPWRGTKWNECDATIRVATWIRGKPSRSRHLQLASTAKQTPSKLEDEDVEKIAQRVAQLLWGIARKLLRKLLTMVMVGIAGAVVIAVVWFLASR